MFLHGIFILTDWLDKTSNISILSCKLQTPALLPTHVTVGLPQMEGVAYSAICDATFMSRRVIRVRFSLNLKFSRNRDLIRLSHYRLVIRLFITYRAIPLASSWLAF